MKSLCVMPVYNQVTQLPKLMEKCRQNMPVDYFFIVDNGSNDGSSEIIDKAGFEHIHLDKNYGVGYALRIGAEKAFEYECDIVVNIAGNGKMLPEQMERVLDPIYCGKADYVTGSRFMEGGDSPNLPLFRRISIPFVVNNLVLLLYWQKVSDVTNGYRAYRVRILNDPRVKWKEKWLSHYQFEYYIYAKALKLGYQCVEVPISMIYPENRVNYSKIRPFVGWWEMLEPWFLVSLNLK